MSTAADRLRLHRARQRSGKMVLSVEVDRWRHVDLLQRVGLLREWDEMDRRKIEAATARLLLAIAAGDS
jgi:hypothetical protein